MDTGQSSGGTADGDVSGEGSPVVCSPLSPQLQTHHNTVIIRASNDPLISQSVSQSQERPLLVPSPG